MLRADSHDAHATSFKSASSRGSATALCFPAEIAFIGRGGKGIPKPDAPLTSPAAQGSGGSAASRIVCLHRTPCSSPTASRSRPQSPSARRRAAAWSAAAEATGKDAAGKDAALLGVGRLAAARREGHGVTALDEAIGVCAVLPGGAARREGHGAREAAGAWSARHSWTSAAPSPPCARVEVSWRGQCAGLGDGRARQALPAPPGVSSEGGTSIGGAVTSVDCSAAPAFGAVPLESKRGSSA
eukprot:scaffold64466_cov24-Tisochrysis_lutea.AAC.3